MVFDIPVANLFGVYGLRQEQAVWVAQQNVFDMEAIEVWSANEKMSDKFMDFQKRLGK